MGVGEKWNLTKRPISNLHHQDNRGRAGTERNEAKEATGLPVSSRRKRDDTGKAPLLKTKRTVSRTSPNQKKPLEKEKESTRNHNCISHPCKLGEKEIT